MHKIVFYFKQKYRKYNVLEYNNNVSIRPLTRTQTNKKNAKFETFGGYGQPVKHQTKIKIKSFHERVVSLYMQK